MCCCWRPAPAARTRTSSSDTTAADSGQQADLLGPENAAAGEPVRVGFVTDGATAAFDTRDETRAAQATVDYWNAHRGGVGGRPIELVTCETGGDPAGGTDCGNSLVSDDVVAVVFGTSAVAEQAWGPLHDAGVPTMLFQATAESMNRDPDSTFLLVNPLPTLFGLPISVAQRADADKVAFVVIDVPVAVNAFEADGPEILENAGLDYELVRVPPGTADMTVQMQQLVDDGAGVVHILGNDTFCIAALQGLEAAAYDGEIVAVSQCITDATRQAIPGEELAGISIISGSALGAADDPTYQLYEAVMGAYGDDVTDPESNIPMGAYTVMGALRDRAGGDVGRHHARDGHRRRQGHARTGAPGRGRRHVPLRRLGHGQPARGVHQPVAAGRPRRRRPARQLRGRGLLGRGRGPVAGLT